jgi:hypothetical protein
MAALALCACGGSTGMDHVHFKAEAAGPADATGAALGFDNEVGYRVTLAKARLHVAGIYLNQTVPLSGRPQGGCFLPGTYVGQVIGALDVDLLSPAPAPFPAPGDGLAVEARAGEIWLTGGDIDAADDPTVILDVEGTAVKGGTSWPFSAQITIGSNRLVPSSDPTQPSAHPICIQRLVSPIEIDLTPSEGATLTLRIDPRGYFRTVDFSQLPAATGNPPVYQFANAATDNADVSLYKALHDISGVYDLTLK